MRMLLACVIMWAFVALVVVLLEHIQASDEGVANDVSFATNDGIVVDRIYDKDAGIVCYITVSIEPNISCLRVR